MKAIDVSPAIIEQLSQEPEEAYWFVWDRGTDRPWWDVVHDYVEAFAFESDAAHVAKDNNGEKTPEGVILDGYPRQATIKEAKAARPDDYRPIALFNRDGNLIRVLA